MALKSYSSFDKKKDKKEKKKKKKSKSTGDLVKGGVGALLGLSLVSETAEAF